MNMMRAVTQLFDLLIVFVLLFLLLDLVSGEPIETTRRTIAIQKGGLFGSELKKECNMYRGKWVFDESYPLYDPAKNCPFMLHQFTCQANGRPDHLYLKLRWQPHGCHLPRFNGAEFLSMHRNKQILFVGDSLSLNQWQSLSCLLHTSVPQANYTSNRFGDLSTVRFPGYNFSLLMSRNALLVDIVKDRNNKRILKLDSISSSVAASWERADVVIFNSWHWWLHTGRQQPWDLIQVGNKVREDMDRLKAYEIALKTWARWVNTSIDPSKTIVFFQGISPDHANGTDWGRPKDSCVRQTGPVTGPVFPGGPHPAEVVLERVLRRLWNKVHLLNVTWLSQMRKDGHPSFYGTGGHRMADCSHWCLAGVPDTWNQLLYAELIRRTAI